MDVICDPIFIMPLKSSLSLLNYYCTHQVANYPLNKYTVKYYLIQRCKRCQKPKSHIPGCIKTFHSSTWFCNMAPNMTWTINFLFDLTHKPSYIAYSQVICYNPKSAHDYCVKHVEETSFPILQFNTEPHNSYPG